MLVGVIIAKLLVLSEIVLGDNIKMKKFLLVIDLDGSNIVILSYYTRLLLVGT